MHVVCVCVCIVYFGLCVCVRGKPMRCGSASGHCQRSALWDRTEGLQGRALTPGDLTGESACACV